MEENEITGELEQRWVRSVAYGLNALTRMEPLFLFVAYGRLSVSGQQVSEHPRQSPTPRPRSRRAIHT